MIGGRITNKVGVPRATLICRGGLQSTLGETASPQIGVPGGSTVGRDDPHQFSSALTVAFPRLRPASVRSEMVPVYSRPHIPKYRRALGRILRSYSVPPR